MRKILFVRNFSATRKLRHSVSVSLCVWPNVATHSLVVLFKNFAIFLSLDILGMNIMKTSTIRGLQIKQILWFDIVSQALWVHFCNFMLSNKYGRKISISFDICEN